MNAKFIHKIRRLLFSPESRLELFARSLFHRLSATRVNFYLQEWLARRSYKRWIKQQQNTALPELNLKTKQPGVTFLVECKHKSGAMIVTTLESILNMNNTAAQVLLANLSEELPEDHAKPDHQHKTIIKEISPGHAIPIESITGEYLIFCQAGDRFFPSLLEQFFLHHSQTPDGDLIYFDIEINDVTMSTPAPLFKPSNPSPALCLSYNMFSRGFIRTAVIQRFQSSIDPQEELILAEYRLCLKMLDQGDNIQHIPSVLVSQTELPKPETPEAQQIILDHLSRMGVNNPAVAPEACGTRFSWAYEAANLSIIIPSKNNARLLIPLFHAIQNHKNSLSLDLIIVDNDSNDPNTLAFYRSIESEPSVQIIAYQKPFNYSEAINLGVSQSKSDLILLMNDDMSPINSDWLAEMIQWAQRDEIGVVGAKLLRENQTLQHAGIIMGLVGFVGHIYLNAPEDYFGLWGSANWYRDILAVTGACQMMRRKVFEDAGGYDENFKLAFGDIDFCLRVHKLGYRNIYTPFARLYHYEGFSRGYATPVKDVLKGYEEFTPYLLKGDPFFSPNLTYSRIPKCAQGKTSQQLRQQEIDLRRSFYNKKSD